MQKLMMVVALAWAGCGGDSGGAAPRGADAGAVDGAAAVDPHALPVPRSEDGFQLSMRATVAPGAEAWVCEVGKLPNHFFANVHRVQVRQNSGTHHLTVSLLGLSGEGKVPPGRYDCKDLYGDATLMKDQIMLYGNQGRPEDMLELPAGIAATLPPQLDYLHEVHFVNATSAPVELYSYVNAYTMPDEEVKAGVYGGSVRDEHIVIPAASTHSEWTRCVMNEDVDVLFLAAHTHALGIEFTVAPFDGTTVGDVFYTNQDWHAPLITQYDPGIHRAKGTGFEWRCTWRNDAPEEVKYGLRAIDEMCNLAVVFTPFNLNARCEVVESSDGVLWRP